MAHGGRSSKRSKTTSTDSVTVAPTKKGEADDEKALGCYNATTAIHGEDHAESHVAAKLLKTRKAVRDDAKPRPRPS